MRKYTQCEIQCVSVLTEVYEHLAITLPHILWHSEDAGHIVVQERVLLLQEEISTINTTYCFGKGRLSVIKGKLHQFTHHIHQLGRTFPSLVIQMHGKKKVKERVRRNGLRGYLREVSDEVATSVVSFSHDVEEKRFDVIVQSLVVQEEFGQQTQVLTVNLREGHHS